MLLAWGNRLSYRQTNTRCCPVCFCVHTREGFLCTTFSTQTPLFPQNSCCHSNLLTRTQSLTSRKCGAFRVNESFRVGRGEFTAGGRPLRHSEGFSMFLWQWQYCSSVILLVHSTTRTFFFFLMFRLFSFSLSGLSSVIYLKYFHIPKCVWTRFNFAPLTLFFIYNCNKIGQS